MTRGPDHLAIAFRKAATVIVISHPAIRIAASRFRIVECAIRKGLTPIKKIATAIRIIATVIRIAAA